MSGNQKAENEAVYKSVRNKLILQIVEILLDKPFEDKHVFYCYDGVFDTKGNFLFSYKQFSNNKLIEILNKCQSSSVAGTSDL